MKRFLKNILIKLCVRLGENSPLMIDWSGISDMKQASALLDTMRLSKVLMPKVVDVPTNKKIVIFAPHPDDEVIGMGGTLIKMIKNGCDVHVIFFTLKDNDEIYNESLKSSKNLGFTAHHLGFERRNMLPDSKSVDELKQLLSDIKPDHLFLTFMLDDHEDHRQCSDILYSIKPFMDGNGLWPEIWAYQVYTALALNTVIDITGVIEEKKNAIRVYQSCFKSRDWAHFAAGLNAFNVRFLPGCNKEGYAEVFYKTSFENYIHMFETYSTSGSSK